jgi:hypothetical protein
MKFGSLCGVLRSEAGEHAESSEIGGDMRRESGEANIFVLEVCRERYKYSAVAVQ